MRRRVVTTKHVVAVATLLVSLAAGMAAGTAAAAEHDAPTTSTVDVPAE